MALWLIPISLARLAENLRTRDGIGTRSGAIAKEHSEGGATVRVPEAARTLRVRECGSHGSCHLVRSRNAQEDAAFARDDAPSVVCASLSYALRAGVDEGALRRGFALARPDLEIDGSHEEAAAAGFRARTAVAVELHEHLPFLGYLARGIADRRFARPTCARCHKHGDRLGEGEGEKNATRAAHDFGLLASFAGW
jgi:hypothetical protein